jgi:signal peptidase I
MAAHPPNSFRPRPWIAAVLNVALTGLGYLYAGRPWRAGLALAALYVWVVALVLLSFAAPSAFVRVGLLILALGAPYVLLPLDAARVARRQVVHEGKRWYQRWYILLATWVIAALVGQGAVLNWIKAHVAEAFRIPTGSMGPTLVAGDLVLASPRARDPIRRDDVVIYRVPDDENRFVHRAVGIPGDTLVMRSFRLSVNGRPYEGPQVLPVAGGAPDHPDQAFVWQRTRLVAGSDTSAYRPTYGTWGRSCCGRTSTSCSGMTWQTVSTVGTAESCRELPSWGGPCGCISRATRRLVRSDGPGLEEQSTDPAACLTCAASLTSLMPSVPGLAPPRPGGSVAPDDRA